MTALLTAGSTRMLKALVSGDGVSRTDIAEVAAAMFQALLGVQEQSEALARIDAKLDRSLQQDFDRSYRLGVYLLRDAANSELHPAAQDEALKSARTRFLEAAAGTSKKGQHVQALHAAAGCSLLAGRPATARAELDDAWKEAFALLRTAAHEWNSPGKAPQSNFVSEFLFGTATTQKRRVQAELEEEVAPLRPIIEDMQNVRRALGASAEECPIPYIPRRNDALRPLSLSAQSAYAKLPELASITVRADFTEARIGGILFEERVVFSQAEAEIEWAPSRPTVNAAFYAASLPELGWRPAGDTQIHYHYPPRQGMQKLHHSGRTPAEGLVVEMGDVFGGPFIRVGFRYDQLRGSSAKGHLPA